MAWSSDMSTDNTYIKYQIGITLNSQDVANNTSNVTVQVRVHRTNSGYTTQGTGTVYCKIDGTKYSASITSSQTITSSWRTIFTKTLNITHSADGTKSLKCSAWIDHSRVTSSEQSYSQTLTTIPRASEPTLSAASTEMGQAVTITTNRASSSFTHTLTYKFGSATGTIGTDVGASKSWTITTSLASQIPNATSGSGTITCKTYSGTTLIGEKSISFTATVPSSIVPTISSIALSDPKGFATTYGGYVQGKSQLKVQVTSAGASGSTISSVQITALGTTVTTNPWTSNTISVGAGSQTVSVKVTDSRNRTATKTATFTVVGYTSPTITKLTASRCNSSGTAQEDGAYMKISYAGSISSLGSKNTKSFVVRHRVQGTSTWTNDVNVSNVYSVDSSVIVAADVNKTYDVSFVVTDAFGSAEQNWNVSTAYTLLDFRSTGKGIAFGKASEKDAFECEMDAEFKTSKSKETTLSLGTYAGGGHITTSGTKFYFCIPTGRVLTHTTISALSFNMIIRCNGQYPAKKSASDSGSIVITKGSNTTAYNINNTAYTLSVTSATIQGGTNIYVELTASANVGINNYPIAVHLSGISVTLT